MVTERHSYGQVTAGVQDGRQFHSGGLDSRLRRMRLLSMAAYVGLISSVTLRAEEPVEFNLRCPDPCTFHQGESIWLDLDFTASIPNNLRVLTNYTDREMAGEEFIVTPQEGASDPIAPYIPAIRIGGGSFHFIRRPLSRMPVTVRINLNQFVRFDQAGTYHVSVLSKRVSDATNPRVLTAVPAQSNEAVVQILPADPHWQAQQLERILRVLNRPLPRSNEPPNEIRDLCNLDTEAAAIEIAHRIGNESRFFFLYEYGLIRSPYRAEGVREMERLLADPDFAVTELFLGGMAAASVDPGPDSAYRYMKKRTELRERLIELLPGKRGTARSLSERQPVPPPPPPPTPQRFR